MPELDQLFNIFDREDFIYRLDKPGAKETRDNYSLQWNLWKDTVANSLELANVEGLEIEGTENWRNSGVLSKRFWTRIKKADRRNSSSCIAVMINKFNLRVYLEWHGRKGKDSSNTIEDHNRWIEYLEEWITIKNINPADYRIWVSEQDDYEDYITLDRFLQVEELQEAMMETLRTKASAWVRVGLLFSKEDIRELDHEEEIAQGIEALEWIYEKTASEPKQKRYWLFNTYYSQDEQVWQYSKQNGCLAMQYEVGKQDKASVTRNINLAKQISVGDTIIAYTGDKGFLGCGVVTDEFYNEDDPSKFLNVNGSSWRQRIGVRWENSLNEPVKYKENGFLNSLGIQHSAALSSNTIVEIEQSGFDFVKDLLKNYTVKDPKEKYSDLSQKEIVQHVFNYIRSRGFFYEYEEIQNFFLSLRTKPFVILSGISGTGKTKIVELFAESLGATDRNGRLKLIPVRPDWSDGSDLLGYVDIKGEFQEGPLTKVIQDASNDKENPYFVILDEMNLARVEYYFSDFLSVIESRKWEEGEIITTDLLPEQQLKQRITIPQNLYIIGTVNMDETTHPFSKKVLDRANTIEFNQVKLDYLDFLAGLEEVSPKLLHNDRVKSEFLYLKDAYQNHKSIIHDVAERLNILNEILTPIQAHIGYRVRDEICFYLIYSRYLTNFDEAFDYQIHQKILPRITANEPQAFQVLQDVFTYCTDKPFEETEDERMIEAIQDGRYPKSANKVYQMLRRGQLDGFTSFWIG